MKRLLVAIILTNIIWANCSDREQANRLWQQSRNIQGIQKEQILTEAYKLCPIDEIEVDFYIYRINKKLKNEELSLDNLYKLGYELSDIRSLNDTLLSSVKSENGEEILRLDKELVEREIKLEQDSQKLQKLYAYKSTIGDKYKGIRVGEKIDVLIQFANGKDKVQSNNGANQLLQKIKASLKDNPNAKFTFIGYASSLGNAKANMSLSERRAENTKRYIERYIKIGNIRIQGKGESQLVCSKGKAIHSRNKEYSCPENSIENETASRRIEAWRLR